MIADRWFSAKERIWASTIATLSYLIGWAVGFILPPYLIEELGVKEFICLKILMLDLDSN